KITNEDWCAVLGGNRHRLQVVQRAKVAESANHVFGSSDFEHAPANFVCAGANFFNHRGKGNCVCTEFVGVEIDLVLANEASDGGDFGHSRHRFELIAQIAILNASQVGQTVLARVGYQD